MSSPLAADMSLAELRDVLLRLEETIIFGLMERACVGLNRKVLDKSEFLKSHMSGNQQKSYDVQVLTGLCRCTCAGPMVSGHQSQPMETSP